MYLSSKCIYSDTIDQSSKEFYFEISNTPFSHKTIFYNGDELIWHIDNLCSELYGHFMKHLFKEDEYYDQVGTLPLFVYEAGRTTESGITKEQFDLMLTRFSDTPKIYKHLYLVDCQFIISSIQSSIIGLNWDFFNFYKVLSDVNPTITKENSVICVSSESVEQCFSILTNYFIRAYTLLDLLTKVSFELENIRTDFIRYAKWKSKDTLWGDKKRLSKISIAKTIFEPNEDITTIESLRNELVHNATWEMHNRAYIKFEEGTITERWLCFPDMQDGHLIKYINRNRFYGHDKKANDILIQLHLNLLERIKITLDELLKI